MRRGAGEGDRNRADADVTEAEHAARLRRKLVLMEFNELSATSVGRSCYLVDDLGEVKGADLVFGKVVVQVPKDVLRDRCTLPVAYTNVRANKAAA